MNLNLIGHQLEITPALRTHVTDKLARIRRHFDHVIDVHVTLSTNRIGQKAEASLHLPGKEIHCECEQADLYAAIDLLIDKLDRQVLKYKDLHSGRPAGAGRHGQAL
jgi:putative sigma-54 modulation protein